MKPSNKLDRYKKILSIAWPLIVSNSFWNIQLIIDRVFLSDYSTEALAASVAVMGIFWTPMALLQGTASYVMTFVAQYNGAKKLYMIGPVFWQSLYISVFGGLLFLLLIPISNIIFGTFGHPPELQKVEVEYFVSVCWSALPTALIAAASGYFTGLGRTQIIILINAMGALLNTLLDYLLIAGRHGFPELGVTGAGYATAISSSMAALFALWLIFFYGGHPAYKLKSGWRIDLRLSSRFLRFGLPSGAQWALEGLAFAVFLILIGQQSNGLVALSASSIAVTLMMLTSLPVMGLGQGVSVLVGHYLGEKKPDHAQAIIWDGFQIALMYIIAIDLTFILLPDFYLRWFENQQDGALSQQVYSMAKILLWFVVFFTLSDSINLTLSYALKGAGDTRFISLVALLLPWPIMVIPTYLTGNVYWAWAFASLYIGVQTFVFWRRMVGGKWKTKTVIDDSIFVNS